MSKVAVSAIAAAAVVMNAAVADAKVISRTNFSKYANASCPAFNICSIDFGKVPAKHIFEIRTLSCTATIHASPAILHYMNFEAFTPSKSYGQIVSTPTVIGTSGGITYISATNTAYVRAPAGASLAATVQSTAAGNVDAYECTISGTDLKLG